MPRWSASRRRGPTRPTSSATRRPGGRWRSNCTSPTRPLASPGTASPVMIFSWLRNRRRRKLLARPFPAAWLEYLNKNVAHYRFLSPAEQAKLRDDLRIFVAEKNWEGCGGLAMTDEVRVTIAAQACL